MTSHRPVFISKRSLITGALFCRMWRTIIMSVINKTTLGLLTLFCSPSVLAQLPGIISQPLANGGQSWSLPVQTLVFITTLSFLPAALLMMTSFTRIIIVLGLLRNAMGTPSARRIR